LLLPTSSVVTVVRPTASTPRGVAIDVSNLSGGRCRTYRQHPLRGPPSTSSTLAVAAAGPADSTPRGPPLMSSTSVVVTAGPAASTPQGARHQRLQLRWWPLLEIPTATPGGLPSMSPILGVAATGPADSTPQGARHRRLQLRWWPLPDLPPAGGPPSTSSTPVMAAARNPNSTPRGPSIDISNFSGGRCRTCRQHPQGGHHRRLQLQWWPLSDLPPALPRGPPSTSPTPVVAAVRPAASNPQGAHH
jgi:hypothetical protein